MKDSKVVRYDVNYGGRLDIMEDGNYVKLEDFKSLESKLSVLRIAVDCLSNGIANASRIDEILTEWDALKEALRLLDGEGRSD